MIADIDEEICSRIKEKLRSLNINCPNCENIMNAYYYCTTCKDKAGISQINILDWLEEKWNIMGLHGLHSIEIFERIKEKLQSLEVECPDCEDMDPDCEDTCAVCCYAGGHGKINILDWLKEGKWS